MQTRPTNSVATRLRWGAVVLLVLALVATACQASTSTLTETDAAQSDSAPVESASEPAAEPAESQTSADDTSAVDEPPADPSNEPAEDPADEPADTTTDPAIDDEPNLAEPDAALDAGDASVELLDAGSEPRRELRFNIAQTCGEVSEMTQTQELSQVADGSPLPSPGPISTITRLETSVTPSGDNYDVRAVVVSAEAAPGTDAFIASTLDSQLSLMVGLTSISTITNRGILLPDSVRVEGTGGLGEMAPLLEGLSQAQNPLPFEPVGLGARWVTRSAVDIEGLLVETITTFELVDLDETLVTLNVSGTQEVAIGGVMSMQGIRAEVTQWDITSTGSVTMDLATISPLEMTTQSFGTQGFAAAGTQIVQDISTEISMSTEPNTGCTGRTTRP